MEDQKSTPGLKNILSTDYLSKMLVTFPIVIIGLYVVLVVFGKIPDPRIHRHGEEVMWIGADQAHIFSLASKFGWIA